LVSSIRKNLALEGSQRWFRGYRIARSELAGPLYPRAQRHLPKLRTTIHATRQRKTIREAILAWWGAGLASGEPVRVRLFADFLRKLKWLDEAGRCAFCWIWWGRRYL